MFGCGLLIFVYQIYYFNQVDGLNGEDYGQISQSIQLAVTVALISYVFGQISNGGHFNPAVTLGLLVCQYDLEYRKQKPKLPSKKSIMGDDYRFNSFESSNFASIQE